MSEQVPCPECGLFLHHTAVCGVGYTAGLIRARDELAAQVSSLTAENERLRQSAKDAEITYGQLADHCVEIGKELDEARAENERLQKRLEAAWDRGDEDGNQKVVMFVEKQELKAEVERLRKERDDARQRAAIAFKLADRCLCENITDYEGARGDCPTHSPLLWISAAIFDANRLAAMTPVVEALRLLVQLKDGPRDDLYHVIRGDAWQAAREALAAVDNYETAREGA